MKRVISVSLGELVLKGGNRKYFEDKLVNQMRKAIDDIGYDKIYKEQGKFYVEGNPSNYDLIINRLKKVFGLVYISPCIRVDKDMENIGEAAKLLTKEKLDKLGENSTFKVETVRADKSFPIESPKVSAEIGAVILREFGKSHKLTVDVHEPDFQVFVDIKRNAYVYIDRIEAYRGMPVGTSGKGMLLLSGGIDSPVAGFQMARRGVELNAVHYHSYPFTSDRAEEKVKDLARILTRYVGSIKIHSVNILEIQKAIDKNCPEEEMTILSRRFMMRIAEKIALKNGCGALITGESLGQVASQTMESMGVINNAVEELPILRPLIGMDKVDIIEISRDIETYETSIQPFVDSCTVFLPDNPVIKPKLKDIEKSEEALDIDKLVDNAIKNMEVYTID